MQSSRESSRGPFEDPVAAAERWGVCREGPNVDEIHQWKEAGPEYIPVAWNSYKCEACDKVVPIYHFNRDGTDSMRAENIPPNSQQGRGGGLLGKGFRWEQVSDSNNAIDTWVRGGPPGNEEDEDAF